MNRFCAIAIATAVAAAPAAATTLRITVTNNAQGDGIALTPVYAAVHNAAFDAFDAGQPASAGIELIAELGDPSGLPPERTAADPGSTAGVVFPTGGMRPLFGGESGTIELTVANPGEQRFFTFLSMLVPSNDTFIGTDEPIALFDAGGAFLGPRSIDVTGLFVYDAGTEANDPGNFPAFLAGVPGDGPFVNGDPAQGSIDGPLVSENGGLITRDGLDLTAFAGLTTAPGFAVTSDLSQLSFLAADAAQFSLATITIEEVAPIPLPAAAWMLLAGLGALGAVARRRG